MEQEQALSQLDWAILDSSEAWRGTIKPYLEAEKNRILLELCSAETPDARAILQGRAQAITDLLLKPQIEEYYRKQREKREEEEYDGRGVRRPGARGSRARTR